MKKKKKKYWMPLDAFNFYGILLQGCHTGRLRGLRHLPRFQDSEIPEAQKQKCPFLLGKGGGSGAPPSPSSWPPALVSCSHTQLKITTLARTSPIARPTPLFLILLANPKQL